VLDRCGSDSPPRDSQRARTTTHAPLRARRARPTVPTGRGSTEGGNSPLGYSRRVVRFRIGAATKREDRLSRPCGSSPSLGMALRAIRQSHTITAVPSTGDENPHATTYGKGLKIPPKDRFIVGSSLPDNCPGHVRTCPVGQPDGQQPPLRGCLSGVRSDGIRVKQMTQSVTSQVGHRYRERVRLGTMRRHVGQSTSSVRATK
jgi:hypothetical protein